MLKIITAMILTMKTMIKEAMINHEEKAVR